MPYVKIEEKNLIMQGPPPDEGNRMTLEKYFKISD
jgi:hypothetical protein